MVELRKRKRPSGETHANDIEAPPGRKTTFPMKILPLSKSTARQGPNHSSVMPKSQGGASHPPQQGDLIELDGFGGELNLTDGEKATLQNLVEISVSGVVVFTYPKANTPGCTKQACLFRDSYQALTALGFSIYGLSRDSIQANMSFRAKYQLPFTLICDKDASLLGPLGFEKAPRSAYRGVIVINKEGKVLASARGGPSATVDAVFPVVQTAEFQSYHVSPIEEGSEGKNLEDSDKRMENLARAFEVEKITRSAKDASVRREQHGSQNMAETTRIAAVTERVVVTADKL